MAQTAGRARDRGSWPATASPWLVLAGAAAVRVVTIGGIARTPNLAGFIIFASDPWGSPPVDPAGSYITGSIIGPVLAHALHLTRPAGYQGLHLVALVVAACVTIALANRLVGRVAATALAIVLVASPMSNVLLSWLGQPDPFTLLGGSLVGLAAMARSNRATAGLALAGGVLGGLASLEQAAIGVVLLAVLTVPGGEARERVALTAAVAGLVIGRGGVFAFHAVSEVPFATRFQAAEAIGLDPLLRAWFRNLPALAWSLLGAAWWLCTYIVRRRPEWRVRAALIAVAAIGTAVIASDETRVVTLVVWPALVRLVVEGVGAEPDATMVRALRTTLLLGLVIPPVVVSSGVLHATTL